MLNNMLRIILLAGLSMNLALLPVAAQNGCAEAFEDAQDFLSGVYQRMTVSDDGTITWQDTDWENVIRRLVGSGEFYLNNCTETDRPLADQEDALTQFATLSLLQPPVETLDVGSDFGEIELTSTFTPQIEWVDLNGDETDELILHTQAPYFSDKTVYQIRGGLSIAFFDDGEDGWQGQIIAPVTNFVTDETGDHVSYAMTEDNTLSTEYNHEALRYFPAPLIEVIAGDELTMPLTTIALTSATGTGETKELNMLTWDGRIPSVELRVAFDDWCYPGRTLDWEIREDGSVFVPSNGGEEGSPLHCGHTPEVLFVWEDGHYTISED